VHSRQEAFCREVVSLVTELLEYFEQYFQVIKTVLTCDTKPSQKSKLQLVEFYCFTRLTSGSNRSDAYNLISFIY